jgi:Uma2 family endonuclease
MDAPSFLAWDSEQEDAHEYVDGQIIAVPNEAPRHYYVTARIQALLVLGGESSIAARLTASLFLGGATEGCVVLAASQRIAAVPGSRYYYADASVVCGPVELEAGTDAMRNPSVLIEVLSRLSEGRDRGEKWLAYQGLASLQEYLLVSQHHAQVERYWRHENGWMYQTYGAGESITLTTGHVLNVDAIYERCWKIPGDTQL